MKIYSLGLFLLKYILMMGLVDFFVLQSRGSPVDYEKVLQVSRDDFSKQFLSLLKNEICHKDNSVIKKCYTLSSSQCSDSVHESVKECINFKVKLPKTIDLISDAESFSRKIGSCVGEKFYRMNKSKIAANKICNSRTVWNN